MRDALTLRANKKLSHKSRTPVFFFCSSPTFGHLHALRELACFNKHFLIHFLQCTARSASYGACAAPFQRGSWKSPPWCTGYGNQSGRQQLPALPRVRTRGTYALATVPCLRSACWLLPSCWLPSGTKRKGGTLLQAPTLLPPLFGGEFHMFSHTQSRGLLPHSPIITALACSSQVFTMHFALLLFCSLLLLAAPAH